jgi:uncharacterized protein YjbI with pentapeptide repeats
MSAISRSDSDPDAWVALQFDERVFVVARETLVSHGGSLFARLFAKGAVSESSLDRNMSHPLKPVLFDRNPRFVEHVIQYLRTGEIHVAADAVELQRGIFIEAEYFHVDGLIDLIASQYPDATHSAADRQRQRLSQPLSQPPSATRAEIEKILMSIPPTGDQGPRVRWRGLRFNGIDFSRLYLGGIDFTSCELNHCNFTGCDMTGCTLTDTELEGANFSEAKLARAQIAGALAPNAILVRADCTEANFERCVLVRVDFTQAVLRHAYFDRSDMTSCVLTGADLKGAKLNNALLRNVERQGTALSMGGVIQP